MLGAVRGGNSCVAVSELGAVTCSVGDAFLRGSAPIGMEVSGLCGGVDVNGRSVGERLRVVRHGVGGFGYRVDRLGLETSDSLGNGRE